MATYEITAVAPKARDWDSSKGGPMKAYRVTLRNSEGREMQNVEWSRKATSPAPAVGEKVDGTVDTSGQYGPKFTAERKMTFSGGGGGVGRPRDPAERHSIEMQSSLTRGVETVRLAIDAGVFKPTNVADVAGHVLLVATDYFDRIQEVAK